MSSADIQWSKRIVSNPNTCSGKARIKGTRITVDLILDCLSYEMSWDEIIDEYPQLEKDDIKAAIEFTSFLRKTSHLNYSGKIIDRSIKTNFDN